MVASRTREPRAAMRMFSPRCRASSSQCLLARARCARRPAELIDLTISNPTRAGIVYPERTVRSRWPAPGVAHYHAGAVRAAHRAEAVAGDYARRGVRDPGDRIVLTASTSEAYSLLFKLLCAPAGDAVLVPAPSYPLFDHLTASTASTPRPTRLDYDGRWWSTSTASSACGGPDARGARGQPEQPDRLGAERRRDRVRSRIAARARDAALIVDEVFADYPLGCPGGRTRRGHVTAGRTPGSCLTFRLGGLSKSAALPQVKLGWIAVDGPERARRRGAGAARVDLRHLSVGVDAGAGRRAGADCRRRRRRARRSSSGCAPTTRPLRQLRAACPTVEVLHADGGWSAVLRVAATAARKQIDARAARARRRGRVSRILLRLPARGLSGGQPAAGAARVSPTACRPCWSASMADARLSRRPARRRARSALLDSVARELGRRRDCRSAAIRALAGGGRARPRAAAAGQRNGGRAEFAVLGAERDGHRSGVHRAPRRRGVRRCRRRGGARPGPIARGSRRRAGARPWTFARCAR